MGPPCHINRTGCSSSGTSWQSAVGDQLRLLSLKAPETIAMNQTQMPDSTLFRPIAMKRKLFQLKKINSLLTSASPLPRGFIQQVGQDIPSFTVPRSIIGLKDVFALYSILQQCRVFKRKGPMFTATRMPRHLVSKRHRYHSF